MNEYCQLIKHVNIFFSHTLSPRYDIDMSVEPYPLRVTPVTERDLWDVDTQLRDTDTWKLSDASNKALSAGDRNKAQSARRKQRERIRFKVNKDAVQE